MINIKQIRESYNLIVEKDDDMRKLTALARSGLFDVKKIPMLKRALQKDSGKLNPVERKLLLDLLDSLMDEVLHSQQVYTKVKQDVMRHDMHENKQDDYLSKYDPRGDKEYDNKKMPAIILLKRKAIRVYPDHQKVALYYSQALDKYITIPFGENVPGINEWTEEDYINLQRNAIKANPNGIEAGKIKNISPAPSTAPEDPSKKNKSFDVKNKDISPAPSTAPEDPSKKNKSFDVKNKDFTALHKQYMEHKIAAHSESDPLVKASHWEQAKNINKQIEANHGKDAAKISKNAGDVQLDNIKNKSKESGLGNVPSGWEGVGHLGAHGALMVAGAAGRVTGKIAQTIAPKTSAKVASGVSNAVKSITTGVGNFGRATGILPTVKESFYAKIQNKQQINELSLSDVGNAADTAADWVVPYYSAGKKLYKGDYAGAATDAAIDTAALAVAGPLGRVGAKLGTKLFSKGVTSAAEKVGTSAAEKVGTSAAEKVGTSAAEKAAPTVASRAAARAAARKAALGAGVGALAGGSDSSSSAPSTSTTGPSTPYDMKNNTKTNNAFAGQMSSQGQFISPTQQVNWNKSITKPQTQSEGWASKLGGRLTRTAGFVGGAILGGSSGNNYTPASTSTTGPSTPYDMKNSTKTSTAVRAAGTVQGGLSPVAQVQYNKALMGNPVSETVINQIREFVKSNRSSNNIVVNENLIDINTNIAEKVLTVYESLNAKNKAKFEKMLSESKESFRKAVNFALGY